MALIGAILLKYSYYVGMAAMLVVSLCIFKKFKLNLFQTLLFTLVAFLSDGLGAFLMGKIYTAVIASLGRNDVSTYSIYGAVFLTPVLVIASAAVIKQPWRQIIDMIALSEMFARAFGKLGCHFGGCCAGIMWEHGIYNHIHETNMFPSALCEFITMLVIIVIGFCFAFKSKRYVPGSLYPLTALLYGGTRFFLEFFRYYESYAERHYILGMSLWQFCSLIAVALSIVWLIGIKNDWLGKAKAYVAIKQEEKAEAERKAKAEKRKNKKKKINKR